MEFFGFMAFMVLIMYSSYPSKVKKLERKVKLLNRKLKGENTMSKVLNDLKDKLCIIIADGTHSLGGKALNEGTITDVDDEWVKITFKDKHENTKIKIIRIDDIKSIEIKV